MITLNFGDRHFSPDKTAKITVLRKNGRSFSFDSFATVADSLERSRSLAGIASIVALATLIIKVFGLVREQARLSETGLQSL